jgi:hypothetical protein
MAPAKLLFILNEAKSAVIRAVERRRPEWCTTIFSERGSHRSRNSIISIPGAPSTITSTRASRVRGGATAVERESRAREVSRTLRAQPDDGIRDNGNPTLKPFLELLLERYPNLSDLPASRTSSDLFAL